MRWRRDPARALIEPLKWTALLVMFAEHWTRYVVGELPAWLFAGGRVVLPLFVFAFALGLRAQPKRELTDFMPRLLVWAAVAQATMQLVDAPPDRLNVLFTFALGLSTAWAVSERRPGLLMAIVLCAIGAVSLRSEFGPAGVAFVAGSILIARAEDPPVVAWLAVAGLLVMLAIPNGNHWALAAVPLAMLLALVPIRIPRVRGVFYWGYALQFPVYAVARHWLA